MKSTHWKSIVRNPRTPKRSVVYRFFTVLTAIVALVQALAQEPYLFIVLSYAGLSIFFWFAAILVRRKEKRNETPTIDEFLRDSLVSENYAVHYFVVISTISTFSATIIFFIDWSFGIVLAFPAALFGYLAYVSYRKKKSTIEQLD
ncbi:MAG: hypothetical protein OXG15_02780 [Gammaproteobacteria bacterium]|nr:hypothetical protein [Gammaproteobacteria bacterium]